MSLCHREYREESARVPNTSEFGTWLRRRCSSMTEAEQLEMPELMALSIQPSKKVCSFRGMTSFGSHYRVDMEEGGPRHVTFDSGVAELRSRRHGRGLSSTTQVELIRVGVLKNILVLSYGNLHIVLMVVSWVAKHIEVSPRLRRDGHGFWVANMAARPRDTTTPYLLPSLASQVVHMTLIALSTGLCGSGHCPTTLSPSNHGVMFVQVFFVQDKAMPG